MRLGAYVFLTLGALLLVIEILQQVGLVDLLDDPLTGFIGTWLTGSMLLLLSRRSGPPKTENEGERG